MDISFNTFTFIVEAREILLLPYFKGSTLRGGFGNAFKQIVCALKKNSCLDCLLKEKCVYCYVFETPPPADTKIMKKYDTAPHPFILEPPMGKERTYKPGETLSFGFTLMGKALAYLPYFIYAFDELGRIGIGKGRGKFFLKNVLCNRKIVYNSEEKAISPCEPSLISIGFNEGVVDMPPELEISFLTPTRITYDKHLILDLEFHILVRSLLRRLSLLHYFHCNGTQPEWDFRALIDKATEITVKNRDLRWFDWERYSARQDTRMKLGGFTGKILFEGNIGPFMSLIKAGAVLHVGKGTSFGLGGYVIV